MRVEAMKEYLNHQHYIDEGWSKTPKKTFIELLKLMQNENISEKTNFLDVGCATGELIHYLKREFKDSDFSGIDVTEALINEAKKYQPEVNFNVGSILDEVPIEWAGRFDVVTLMGVLSIFDEEALDTCLQNLFTLTKKGGKIFILSPFNEYGIDALIKHRKNFKKAKETWEAGWNIFSLETIREKIENKCASLQVIPFNVDFQITPKIDPIRTWTTQVQDNPFQLTNGLKLLINHYFLCITN